MSILVNAKADSIYWNCQNTTYIDCTWFDNKNPVIPKGCKIIKIPSSSQPNEYAIRIIRCPNFKQVQLTDREKKFRNGDAKINGYRIDDLNEKTTDGVWYCGDMGLWQGRFYWHLRDTEFTVTKWCKTETEAITELNRLKKRCNRIDREEADKFKAKRGKV